MTSRNGARRHRGRYRQQRAPSTLSEAYRNEVKERQTDWWLGNVETTIPCGVAARGHTPSTATAQKKAHRDGRPLDEITDDLIKEMWPKRPNPEIAKGINGYPNWEAYMEAYDAGLVGDDE